ncbi:MAG: hypothetical protein KZQ81_01605 [Candidatus Thiodiazotropha sp. (ex Rostrolucina anterorostrata)]|nr:hypothetical protein [Candidatus Thiodiazotropha sp. (ex Rostrolucina anterorostrata)]
MNGKRNFIFVPLYASLSFSAFAFNNLNMDYEQAAAETWGEWARCQPTQTFESCASIFSAMDVRRPVWKWNDFTVTFSRDGTDTAKWVNETAGGSGTLHIELMEGVHYLKDSCIYNCDSNDRIFSDITAKVTNSVGHFVGYVRLYKGMTVGLGGQQTETVCVTSDWRLLSRLDVVLGSNSDICTVKRF